MVILLTVFIGLILITCGAIVHRTQNEDYDNSIFSSEDFENDMEIFGDLPVFDEHELLNEIEDDHPQETLSNLPTDTLLSFTQTSQVSDKQLPLLGLPDKSLYLIH